MGSRPAGANPPGRRAGQLKAATGALSRMGGCQTVPTPRRADPAATTAARGGILIIDDDRDVAEGTAEVLHEAGYSVAIALTARAA